MQRSSVWWFTSDISRRKPTKGGYSNPPNTSLPKTFLRNPNPNPRRIHPSLQVVPRETQDESRLFYFQKVDKYPMKCIIRKLSSLICRCTVLPWQKAALCGPFSAVAKRKPSQNQQHGSLKELPKEKDPPMPTIHGTPLSPGEQEAFLGAMMRAAVNISHHIDPNTADGWVKNTQSLKEILARQLVPPSRALNNDCVSITLGPTTIAVNLEAVPKRPYPEAIIGTHNGLGWVILERHFDGLYMNDRKVVRLACEQRKIGSITGPALRRKLKSRAMINANILDVLAENHHLIPEDWTSVNGGVCCTFFLGSEYRDFRQNTYVRSIIFDAGGCHAGYRSLNNYFGGHDRVASLEV